MPVREYQNSNARLNGAHFYLGTIVATTTKNNADTATPFNDSGDALKGKLLMIQTDAACYILPGTYSTAAVTANNGLKLAADAVYVLWMNETTGYLAALAVSGTANVKVWELR